MAIRIGSASGPSPPGPTWKPQLRAAELPLYSLETFTPLAEFDVLGFTLQYEICSSNLLAMLDLGGIPLRCAERTMNDPLGDCRRTLRSEPRAAGAVHRSVRHRRRRAEPAGNLSTLVGHASGLSSRRRLPVR